MSEEPTEVAEEDPAPTLDPETRARRDAALTLVRKHAHRNTVMCSHGDIIPMLLEHYAARGVDLGMDPVCPKGCTWVLEIDGAQDVVAATYLAPPTE